MSFACSHTDLDLAGLSVSSGLSEALEPFKVRFGQWRSNQQRKEPRESAGLPNVGICGWGG